MCDETSPSDRDPRALLVAKTNYHRERLEEIAQTRNIELDNEIRCYFGKMALTLAWLDTTDNPQEKRDRELGLLLTFSALQTPEPIVTTVLECYPISPATEEDLCLFSKKAAEQDAAELRNSIEHELEAELAKAELIMPEDEAINDSEHKLFLNELLRCCYEFRYESPIPYHKTHIDSLLEKLALLIDTSHPQRHILLRIAGTLLNR